jgi:hypothetical protein
MSLTQKLGEMAIYGWILTCVHPETVNFWMLGDLRPRSLGPDAHQKRFPGVLVNSTMSK